MTNTILSIIYIVEILMKSKVREGAESNTAIIAVLHPHPSGKEWSYHSILDGQ